MSTDTSSCWTILSLLPTTDRKAVRSAYALALKRLDLAVQADEFAALRAAYDQALGQIADGTVPLVAAPETNDALTQAPQDRIGTIRVDDFDAPARIHLLEAGTLDPNQPTGTGTPVAQQDTDTPTVSGIQAEPTSATAAPVTDDDAVDTGAAMREVPVPRRARDLGLRPAQQTGPSEAELAQLMAHQRVNAFFQLCDSFGVPRTAILQQALHDFFNDEALDSLLARELFTKELTNQAFAERLYTPTLIPALSAELGWELDAQAMPATAGGAQLAFQRWQRQRDYQRLQMHYSATECEALDDVQVEWRVRAARHIAAVGVPDIGKLAAMTDEVLNRSVPALSASEQEKHFARLKHLIVDDVAEIGHYDLYCAVADVLRCDRMSPQEFERNHYYIAQQLLEDGRVARAIKQAERQADPMWEPLSNSVREGYLAWEQKRFGTFLRFFLGTAFGFMRYDAGVIGKLGYLRRNRARWNESFEPPCRNWLRVMWLGMFAALCMAAAVLAAVIVTIYIVFEMR